MPEAVCFDNDGLMLDTESAWSRAEVVLFRRHGSQFTEEHKRYILGSAAGVAALKLEEMLGLPGQGAALWAELHELVMDEAARGVEPMPGAVELLDDLRAAGTPVGLISNSAREFVELTLQTAGVADRFDVVLAREDVERPKPAPDLYRAGCVALGADPARSVGLEDTATGVAAVKAAGMTAIGVPWFPGIALEEADLVVASLADRAVRRVVGL